MAISHINISPGQYAAIMEKSERKPPTENQLNRINQLLDLPGMSSYVYDSIGKEKFANLISSLKGAGVVIGMMKKRANIK